MKTTKFFLFFYSFLMILAYIGCGKDNTVVNPPPSGGAFTLSGTIEGYPGGSVIAKARIYKFFPLDSFFVGTDTIDNNAQLSISISTPPTDFLMKIQLDSNIVISDTTAKTSGFNNLSVYNFSNQLIAQITKKNFTDTNIAEGSFVVNYVFSNKAVTVTGYDTTINNTDTLINGYHLILASGWNTITVTQTFKRINFAQVDYTNGESAGATWRYESVPSPILFRNRLLH